MIGIKEIIEIKTSVAVVLSKLDTIETTLNKIDKAIYGNGRDGLIVKVSNLKRNYVILFWLFGVIVAGIVMVSIS